MPTVTVVWRSVHDNRRCKICENLEGYTWQIIGGNFKGFLEHPQYGIVSTAEHGSMVQHSYGVCRCHLEYSIDWADTIRLLTRIRDNIKVSLGGNENPELAPLGDEEE